MVDQEKSTGFDALPEGCIAKILSCTTPLDVCRLSLVSPSFLSAANSDALWLTFLPSDYQSIISQSSTTTSSSTKKDLFITLCHNPQLNHDAKKCIWLDKHSGKKCYMLAARDLMITWGDTPRYWTWINTPDSRFNEVAELRHVWWFEIRGKIHASMLSAATSYAAYLVFKLQTHAYGFHSDASEVSIGIAGIGSKKSTVCLSPDDAEVLDGSSLELPKGRKDGWLEIELGEYFIEFEEDGELEMSIMEVKSSVKSGIIVQGIEIRPKLV